MERNIKLLVCPVYAPGALFYRFDFPGIKETMITSYDVKTSFVEGTHEQLEPNDGVNDDDEQY